jgi:ParB-like nuclease domain
MVEKRRLFTKEEYVTLIPTVTDADFQRLKNSIKKEGRLLMPITINQDNIVLDGHHRLRACKELGISAIYDVKDFTGKPIQELEFVVSVNLHRRHLDEFQKAEIGMKMRIMVNRILHHSYRSSAEAQAAANKRYKQMPTEPGQEEDIEEVEDTTIQMPLLNQSRDTLSSNTNTTITNIVTEERPAWAATNDSLAQYVGVSPATFARVETIFQDGTEEQIQALRGGRGGSDDNISAGSGDGGNGNEGGGGGGGGKATRGAGVRTIYEQVQNEKIKDRLQAGSHSQGMHEKTQPKKHNNVKLLNKDFRLITMQEVPDSSVDCIIALDFPEASQKEDEWGRIHGQLMESAATWLKDGGLLIMHVTKPFIPRVLCDRPPMLQYNDILCAADAANLLPAQTKADMQCLSPLWRPYIVYVKGIRDVKPSFPDAPGIDVLASNPEDTKMTVVDYVMKFVRKFSQPGSTVLDPFAGQTKGVLGEAVLLMGNGRQYIGAVRDSTMFLTVLDKLENV